MDELTSLARDFKALGHPVRLAILDALRGGEQCVCHLESALGMRQAYISQQLAVLKEAGIIRERRDGWNRYYRVIRPDIYMVMETAHGAIGRKGGKSTRKPIRSGSCPCPKCHPDADRTPAVKRAPVSE